jgi:hypothetical protein
MASKKDKTQLDKFKAAARELGCDESEAVFDEKLKKMVPVKKGPKKQGAAR